MDSQKIPKQKKHPNNINNVTSSMRVLIVLFAVSPRSLSINSDKRDSST
jgi:hypothetical protein